MPGQFSPSSLPSRPGAYFNWVVEERPRVPVAPGAIVAIPFVNDWGPFEEVVRLASFDDFLSVYGNDSTQPGYKAVYGAFKGEGVSNRYGAKEVVAYRCGGTSAAPASLALDNEAATPVEAVTLTARYEGSRGNDLYVEVAASPIAGHKVLTVYDGTTEVETYDHAETDLAALVAAVNASSDWIAAELGVDGTALADIVSTPLIGGDDGASLAGTDVTDALDALDADGGRFSLFAFFDLAGATYSGGADADSVLTSIVTWTQDHNREGKRFMTVVGGALDEDALAANARSASINDPNIVNLGVGSVDDEHLGALSTSQLAPRIAGVLAFRGETMSLTFARLEGVTLMNGIANDDVQDATDAGTTVLVRDADPVAPVRTDKGVTTYTGGDDTRPVAVYREPKFVRSMHLIETEITDFVEQNVIGLLLNNENTRQLVVGEEQARLNSRAAQGVLIKTEDSPVIRVSGTATDEMDYVPLDIILDFGRAIERVFHTVHVPVGA